MEKTEADRLQFNCISCSEKFNSREALRLHCSRKSHPLPDGFLKRTVSKFYHKAGHTNIKKRPVAIAPSTSNVNSFTQTASNPKCIFVFPLPNAANKSFLDSSCQTISAETNYLPTFPERSAKSVECFSMPPRNPKTSDSGLQIDMGTDCFSQAMDNVLAGVQCERSSFNDIGINATNVPINDGLMSPIFVEAETFTDETVFHSRAAQTHVNLDDFAKTSFTDIAAMSVQTDSLDGLYRWGNDIFCHAETQTLGTDLSENAGTQTTYEGKKNSNDLFSLW